MRLSDILSKAPSIEYEQIEGFLNGKGVGIGKSRKINVGKIALNYFCNNCKDQRTFYSNDELFCIGVNDRMISIDCVLKCLSCGALVEVWFLVESKNKITDQNPEVRIIKKNQKLSFGVSLSSSNYGDYTEYLEKAKRASIDGYGAGAIVYLRKIFENIIIKTAQAANPQIQVLTDKGKRKPFIQILTPVKNQCNIIPEEFSENGYKLFGELSDVVHGEYSEEDALEKFDAFYRLIIGVLDKIKNNTELMCAINRLGW